MIWTSSLSALGCHLYHSNRKPLFSSVGTLVSLPVFSCLYLQLWSLHVLISQYIHLLNSFSIENTGRRTKMALEISPLFQMFSLCLQFPPSMVKVRSSWKHAFTWLTHQCFWPLSFSEAKGDLDVTKCTDYFTLEPFSDEYLPTVCSVCRCVLDLSGFFFCPSILWWTF